MTGRPTLAYIVGTGRCGSTLLERLLGCHEGVVSAGELHLLPHEIQSGGVHLPCGCGVPVDRCPFWQEVVGEAGDAAVGSLRRFREAHTGGRTLRPTVLPLLGRRSGQTRSPRPEVVAYGQATSRLIGGIAAASRRRGEHPAVVVDASKDPYRLLWLLGSGEVDVRVVHLDRHPGGFVRSVLAQGDARPGAARLPFAARKALSWTATSEVAARAARAAGSRALLIAYEDLATAPEAVLARVADHLGIHPERGSVDRFVVHPTHAVGGNPMRFDPGPVGPDRRWREELGLPTRLTVDAITAPTRWRLSRRRDLG